MKQYNRNITGAVQQGKGIFLLWLVLGFTLFAQAKEVIIPCGTTTVNLTTLVTSTPPTGTTVTWHTGSTATDANKVADPTAVTYGVYYAAYNSATDHCYSPTSEKVSVLKTICLPCTQSTFDLTSLSTSAGPAGTVVTWHTGTPATSANQIADPTMVPPGIYYPAFYHAGDMCYSPTGEGVAVSTQGCLPPIANNILNDPINNSSGPMPLDDLIGADQDGTIATYTIESIPPASQGVLLLNGVPVTIGQVLTPTEMSQLTFDPNPNYVGDVIFTYTAQDNDGNDSNVATVTIPVTNEPPTAQNIVTNPIDNEQGPTTIPPLQGSDPDGTVVSYTIETLPLPTQGVLLLNGVPVTAGQVLTPAEAAMLQFDPAPGYVGDVPFTYTSTDNNGNESTPATYTIPVVADPTDPTNNLPPVSQNIVNDAMPNTNGPTNILDLNSLDPDGTIVTYTIETLPPASQGVLLLAGVPVTAGQVLTPVEMQNLMFDPNPNYVGDVVFTYLATDNDGKESNIASYTIPVTNQPPVANNITTPVMANTQGTTPIPTLEGVDQDGTIASYTITTLPPASQGVLLLNGVPVTAGQVLTPAEAGQLSFDPAPGYVGDAVFTYNTTDNSGLVSTPATYTIPIKDVAPYTGLPPVAEPIETPTYPNTNGITAIAPLKADDPDGTIVTYIINSLPPADAGILYLNGIPVTVGQVLTPAEATQLTFDPAPGFIGEAKFNYSATDNSGNLSNMTTYTIPISGTPPVTYDVTSPVMPSTNGPTALPTLFGQDLDGTVVSYTITSLPPAGSGTLLLNGVPVTEGQVLTPAEVSQLQFDPNPDWTAPITTFTYTATDNNGTISNTSTYTIPLSSTVALPVQLVSFTGRANNCKVTLTWKTATELNFSHFELERKIGNGQYTKIATVNATGNNSTYTYTDGTTDKNVSYRLRMVDMDGSAKESNIVFITNACMNRVSGVVSVYPNPTSQSQGITVDYTSDEAIKNAHIVLYDISGKAVLTQAFVVDKGTNIAYVNLQGLAMGSYTLVLRNANAIVGTPVKCIITE